LRSKGSSSGNVVAAFRKGLSETGFVEGRNLANPAADMFVDRIGGFFWHHLKSRADRRALFSEAKLHLMPLSC
jgi:hypothetical protein